MRRDTDKMAGSYAHRSSLLALDAARLRTAYANRSISPVEVTDAVLAAAAEAQHLYAAVTSINEHEARVAALQSEARWKAGTPWSDLDGVPMTFKDSFNIAGLPRWHGSAVSEGEISQFDAAPVRRVREAGIVIVAKTSMPDYGMLMSGLSSRSGVIRNPWDPATNTAGSSSGAAACLACGVAPLGLGTDMVGSVRLPAAVSGLVAIHATQGRVAYDPPGNYRGAGPMARTVQDAAALLAVIGRYDPADRYALPGRFVPDGREIETFTGVKIAVLSALSYGDAVDTPTAHAVDSQAKTLGSLGADITFLPDLDLTPEDYEAVYWLMVHKGLGEFYSAPPERRGAVLPEIGRMFDAALTQSALSMDLVAKRIAMATDRLERQLAPFDYVLSPALPACSFPAEAVSPGPEKGPISHMGFACWFNQLGRPAGTVPVSHRAGSNCPVSVQIAGKRFDNSGVVKILAALERRRGFNITFPIIRLA